MLKPTRTTPRAAADERIHPPYKVANLGAATAEEGLDAKALLDGTGHQALQFGKGEFAAQPVQAGQQRSTLRGRIQRPPGRSA